MASSSGTRAGEFWSAKPYCLRCFTPLPSGEDRCVRCEFVSKRSMRRKRWNLNPDIIRTEKRLKWALVILVPIVARLFAAVPRCREVQGHMSMAGGSALFWGWLGLGMMTLFAWLTVGMLTRRRRFFRATVYWTPILFLSAVVPLICLHWACIPLVLAGACAPSLGRRARRWMQERIDAGARAPAMEEHPSRDPRLAVAGHPDLTGHCLQCLRPLRQDEPHCDACGFVTTRSMSREFWNLIPGLRLLETVLKRTIALALLVSASYVIFAWEPWYPSWTTRAWVLGTWLVVSVSGAAAWHTAEKLTRWSPAFRATLFWTWFLLIGGVVSVAVKVPDLTIGLLVGGALAPVFGRLARRWQLSKLGSTTGEVPSAGPKRVSRSEKPYCLRCFAPLEGGMTLCGDCGFVSRPPLRKIYWNLNPGLRRLESIAKGAVIVLILAACLFLWCAVGAMGLSTGAGPGAGWFLLLPLFFGVACWGTVAKITKRKPYFRATAFWTGFSLLMAAVLYLAVDLWWLIPFAVGFVFLLLGHYARRWQRGIIEAAAGQERAASA
jgi:hypothetical protein